ncbi:thymidine phosphorylase [Peptostreptococcus faecalis]|uniref:thymidine phosphorylase n=1 Tax=Peptostreptococcus faecalis TaxID=2045015 RepID=UPI000C7BB257|nr:thymidine phosphorylase [Peptostreptococcus faecalis]
MRIVDIIEKKKNKEILSKEEIKFWIKGIIDESIEDYQSSALLMAIVLNGMNEEETANLTESMLYSGDIIKLDMIEGIKVDKHSTGGVGDKTTLVLAPLLAACGLKVAKMSGRGLGYTGGTIDKLESIKGYNCYLSEEEFLEQVKKIGVSVIAQTGDLAPADKKLYALRDVTSTVNSIPLIASSIMSKKLAIETNSILLDVKYGQGAFMKNIDDAKKLAEVMISIGKMLGRNTVAMITNMNQPIGQAVGNTLEVIEAIETLKGNGPRDFTELCVRSAEEILVQVGMSKDIDEARNTVSDAINSKSAYYKFIEIVKCQGGDVDQIEDTDKFPKSKHITNINSLKSGYIENINSERIGKLAMELGAGREKIDDSVNHRVGFKLVKKVGDKVKKDDILCTVYHDGLLSEDWVKQLYSAYRFTEVEIGQENIVENIIK